MQGWSQLGCESRKRTYSASVPMTGCSLLSRFDVLCGEGVGVGAGLARSHGVGASW